MRKLFVFLLAFVLIASLVGCLEETVSLYDLDIQVNIVDKEAIGKFIEAVNSGELTAEEALNSWNGILRQAKEKAKDLKKWGVDVRFLGNARLREEEGISEVRITPKAKFYFDDGKTTAGWGYVTFDSLVSFKNGKVYEIPTGVWVPVADLDALRSSPITAVMSLAGESYGEGGGDGGGDGDDDGGGDNGGDNGHVQ